MRASDARGVEEKARVALGAEARETVRRAVNIMFDLVVMIGLVDSCGRSERRGRWRGDVLRWLCKGALLDAKDANVSGVL
jgi:hypothetical protein